MAKGEVAKPYIVRTPFASSVNAEFLLLYKVNWALNYDVRTNLGDMKGRI